MRWNLINSGTIPIGVFVVLTSCIESYDFNANQVDHIIVEGYITNEKEDHLIKISKSQSFSTYTENFKQISDAEVSVMVDGSTRVPFIWTEEGYYVPEHQDFVAAEGHSYVLNILLSNGLSLASEEVTLQKGAPITNADFSVTEEFTNPSLEKTDKVNLTVTTEGNPKASGFYRYTIDETWLNVAFSATGSLFRFNFYLNQFNDPTHIKSIDTLVYQVQNRLCWLTDHKDLISLAASTGTVTSQLKNISVHQFDLKNRRLLYKYSALINQYALDEHAYQFLSLIKSFSEEDGLLFNQQPGSIKGNIHLETESNLRVLGLFQVSEKTSKRIFIRKKEFNSDQQRIIESSQIGCQPNVIYTGTFSECDKDLIYAPDFTLTPAELREKAMLLERNTGLYHLIDSLIKDGHLITRYVPGNSSCEASEAMDLTTTDRRSCADCGSIEGYNVKPEWWGDDFE